MVLSIENARKILNKGWVLMSGYNVVAAALFIAPLFRDLPAPFFFFWLIVAAGLGLAICFYLTYRAEWASTSASFCFFYFLVSPQIMVGGGAAALLVFIGGRPDLCWTAFWINSFFVVISLLGGMYREAQNFGWWKEENPLRWKSRMAEYIDYSRHQIIPAKAIAMGAEGDKWTRYGPIIAMAAQANVALLFGLYGGGKNNAIFFAAPLLVGVFTYLNLKQFGPAFLRLLLVRRLENEAGRRFANADYKQIQALRRTFFLARWFMKDYVEEEESAPMSLPRKRSRR